MKRQRRSLRISPTRGQPRLPSPYLKARPGSTHGYDITDHLGSIPSSARGGIPRHDRQRFGAAGLGQILDFVPNHMGVGGADNPLWLDVLEWGPSRDHAGWFDIDWHVATLAICGDKLLAPFLGEQYGVELKAGKLKSSSTRMKAVLPSGPMTRTSCRCCPLHYQSVLGHDDAELDRLGDLFADLKQWRPEVRERTLALKAKLCGSCARKAEARLTLDQTVAALNDDWRALNAVIQRQFWRVAYFGVAGDDINYRRILQH